MNTTVPVQVEASYSREFLEASAKCFISHYFRSFGRWLLVACVVNAIGFGAVVAFGTDSSFMTAAVAAIAVIGPLYCVYLFAAFPRRYAAKTAAVLVPTAQISFTDEVVEVSAKGRVGKIPWTSIKEVWDSPAAFLLVLSQFAVAFITVPKHNLPASAHDLLARKVRKNAV